MKRGPLVVLTACLLASAARAQTNEEPYPNDPNAKTSSNANANANASAKVHPSHWDETCQCDPMREKQEDRWREKVGVTGLRVSAWRVQGADVDHRGWGLQFAGNSTDVHTHDGFASMSRVFFAIGGGNGGFEGAFGGLIAGGVRLDAADDQGLVLRLGLQGWLQGNNHFYSSHIELPVLQIGWQYARRLTMLEFGAQGGPVLAGRYNPGDDAQRKLGGDWEGTGYLSFHFPHARFDATFTRYTGDAGPGTALDLARATMCFLAKIGICADLSSWRGDVFLPNGAVRNATTTYGGVTLGWSER